ncbi:MAG: DMT family transporter [Burkholderiales bacterium]|nr:DMT family transporter [Burkholderiales bacterium]
MTTHTLQLPAAPGWLLSPQAGLVAATVFWSGNFVVGRALRGEFDPVALNFWRWLIAALVLAPFVWRAFAAQWPVLRAHWPYVVALGFTGLALPHACSYKAVQTTTAVNALLLLNLTPVFVALGAWRLLGRPLARMQCAGIAVSLLGAGSILVRWDIDVLLGLRFNPGDLWMVPAVLASSAHALLLKRTPDGVAQGPLLLASMFAALVLMAPAVLWVGVGSLAAVATMWPAALYVGVFASAIAFLLWNRGVVNLGPERAAPLMYLMPVYASVLSALFIGEGVQAYQFAGGAIVLAGLWMARSR